jgi:hypothetical protein
MENPKHIARPEYLKPRNDGNATEWRAHSGAPFIAAVFTDPTRGEIIAPNDPTELGKLLRTYALVRARYDLREPERAAKYHRLNPAALTVARIWWAQHLTNLALGTTRASWNDGTGSALAAQIETLKPARQFAATIPHLMTNQSRALLREIGKTSPQGVAVLQALRERAAEILEHKMSRPDTDLDNNYADGTATPCRTDEFRLAELARIIEEAADHYDHATEAEKGEKDKDGEPRNSLPPEEYNPSGAAWYPAILGRTNLNRPHIGRIGSKKSPSDSGRNLKYPSRALTDPARRVFQKKQRAKSAVVVLDMSGSMDYTTEELDEMIEACRGAVVVGYSADDDTTPNTFLLAKDGHRVSELPEVCGNNGNDKTALVYAINKYRKSATTPVVWVSDGGISGAGGYSRLELSRDMVATLEHFRVHQCETAAEAIDLIQKMEHGHRPRTNIKPRLLSQALRNAH